MSFLPPSPSFSVSPKNSSLPDHPNEKQTVENTECGKTHTSSTIDHSEQSPLSEETSQKISSDMKAYPQRGRSSTTFFPPSSSSSSPTVVRSKKKKAKNRIHLDLESSFSTDRYPLNLSSGSLPSEISTNSLPFPSSDIRSFSSAANHFSSLTLGSLSAASSVFSSPSQSISSSSLTPNVTTEQDASNTGLSHSFFLSFFSLSP